VKPARAGFSLVEVLASLIVTALIVVVLAPIVRQLLMTWDRGSEVARAVEMKTRGLGLLRDDIRNAIVWTTAGQPENSTTFRGNTTSLRFPAIANVGSGRREIEMLAVTVDPSPDGYALVRRRATLNGLAYGPFTDPIVLLSGPFKFVFRYKSRSGDETAVWSDAADIPGSVALTILDQRGPIFKAPIEFPLFASLPAGCIVVRDPLECPKSAEDE
jgi:hypothetical protein